MPRGLPTLIKTELAKDAISFADLVELHFDPIKRITNASIPIITATDTASSGTYEANGELMSFDTVTETGEAKVNQINLAISGASSTYTSLFLNNDYVDRRVVVYRIFFNQQLQIIDSPVMLFDGEIQSFLINETGDTSTLSVTSASVFYDFERTNGRRTNDTSQKAFFPNDNGLKYSAITLEDLKWGKP
jgi:hypothetical protein